MSIWKSLQSCALRPLECVPARLMVGVMGFFGFINLYMTRVNLSIIAVAMVKKNQSSEEYCLSYSDESVCGGNSTEEYVTTGEMDWSEMTLGLVMSFFFYGYFITQLPGGRLAERVGTKRVFGAAILSSGVLTLLSPAACRWHPVAMCVLRFCLGLSQGVVWPSMHALTVQWIPQHQRPRFMSVVYLAATLGVVVTLPLCGLIISLAGWAAAFYVTGTLSIIWVALWALLIFDHPSDHPRIKTAELELILASVRSTGTSAERPAQVPWKSIAQSLPFWSLITAEIGNAFGLTILVTQYPNFLASVYNFSVAKNSLVSVTPFLARYVGAALWSMAADGLVGRQVCSVTVVRKVFSGIAMLGPALMTLFIVLLWGNMVAVLVLVSVGMFCNGAVSSSLLVNYTDIAPNFAGTIFGIGNSVGSVSASIAPLFAGLLIPDKSAEQWRNVFWTIIPVYVIPELVYLALASGVVQPWNNPPSTPGDGDQGTQPHHKHVEEKEETLSETSNEVSK